MKDQPVAKQNMIIERWQREDQQMKANRQVSANELIGRQSGVSVKRCCTLPLKT